MEKVNFNFIKGDTYSRGFTVDLDYPINQVFFTVKEKSSDKNYVIQKTLHNGIEVDLDNPKRYGLIIEPEDTDNLKTNYDYIFDIEIITDTMKRTIAGGNLTLDDWDITSKGNEV